MAEALDQAVLETWQFVRLKNAVTGVVLANYTDRDSDTDFDGETHISVTAMELKFADNDGLLSDAAATMTIPVQPGVLFDMSRGELYPDVEIEMWEFSKADGASSTELKPFWGDVKTVRRNFNQQPGLIQLECLTAKAGLDQISMGLPCNHQCVNRLSDGQCKVVFATISQNTTLSTMDGGKITVPDVQISPGQLDRHYENGYIEVDGMQIKIVEWRNESNGTKNEFFLSRKPPESWLGRTILLVAGCDKSVENCRDDYNNETEFSGYGYAIPPYHPNFEDGGSRQ